MFTENSTPNKEITDSNDNDSIKNSGAVVKIYAQDGDDSINNSANLVTISGGGNLRVQGQAATGFMLEGMTFAADRSTGTWRTK